MNITKKNKAFLTAGFVLAVLTGGLTFSTTVQAKEIRYKSGVYNGQFTYNKNRKPVPHGQGVFSWNTGKYSRFKGNFMRGKIRGYGTVFFRKGGYCVGQFNSKTKINGGAECRYANGSRYVGNLRNNQRHNSGSLHYKNGSVYSGRWKNGIKHGRGEMRYRSGTTYNGPWVSGKRQTSAGQEGVLRKKDNGRTKYTYIGRFTRNKPDGRGELQLFPSLKRYCVVMSMGKVTSKRKAVGPRSNCYR